MAAPASSWVFLALCVVGFGWTVTAVVRADRLGWGNMLWFLSGWLTSELALVFAATTDALSAMPGRIGLGLMAISWAGLALAQWRTRSTARGTCSTSIARGAAACERPCCCRSTAAAGSWATSTSRPVRSSTTWLQPGFETVDTTVAAAVPFYGVYDFTDRLRSVSRNPVVYAELPGAQHAWDIFRSTRAMESMHAVTRFLEWARATTDRGR